MAVLALNSGIAPDVLERQDPRMLVTMLEILVEATEREGGDGQ